MEDSLQLRIIALFVIMIVSFLGVALPAGASRFFKERTDPTHQISYHHVVKLLAAVGCGCVIATGLCHIAPDGNENLSDTLGEYPAFFAIGTATIVFLYIIEKELALAVERRVNALAKPVQSAGANETDFGADLAKPAVVVAAEPVEVVSSGDGQTELTQEDMEEEALQRMRNALVTHILEVGVAVHSILVGVAFGLLNDVGDIRPLFIALVFHQFCEGAAIGAAVLESGLTPLHTAVMWAIFALTTPLGVAIGVGVEQSQGGDQSSNALTTQGVFDAVAFGILMYMGLVDMLPHLFNLKGCGGHGHGSGDHHTHAYLPVWYRLMIYFFFVIGAGAMVLIAKWA